MNLKLMQQILKGNPIGCEATDRNKKQDKRNSLILALTMD